MAEPRSLEQLAAELARVEAEVTRLRREVAAAIATAKRSARATISSDSAGGSTEVPPDASGTETDASGFSVEITETDRAAARAAARRLGLVVRDGGGRRR